MGRKGGGGLTRHGCDERRTIGLLGNMTRRQAEQLMLYTKVY